jgi:hypothetical protein
MAEIAQGLRLLVDFEVDFIVVGGVAVSARGSSQVTYDLDVCYSRDRANLMRLTDALRSVNATLRGAPKNLPFRLDAETLERGLNFTFDTDIGSLDILGEVQGVGQYGECLEGSDQFELFGKNCRVLSLQKLIAAKKSAGRTKDLMVLPELEAILEQQNLRRLTES